MRYLTVLPLFFLVACVSFSPKTTLPVVKSGSESVSIRDGDDFRDNSWVISPDYRPDVFHASLINGAAHHVTFYTDTDSIQFFVEEGKSYDFVILHGEDSCFTRIVGKKFVPRAVFDAEYQKQHEGQINIEVPELYELVNVAIAITPYAIDDKYTVFKKSPYYESVRQWFDQYQEHALIRALDSSLSENNNRYFSLKMNSYAFEYDANDKIINSPVYDRTGFPGEKINPLRPYLQAMQSFSDASNFREFYQQNKQVYEQQILFYQDTANVLEMKNWLDKHFPSSSDYNSYKLIFSPLVAYNQSFSWFESNGFKEGLAHINYPYMSDFKKVQADVSEASLSVYRGNIAFTEINHGYINPEADKYRREISKAISNRELWVEVSRGPNYYGGIALFNEYMNWALISLRFLDYVPEAEQDVLIQRVERMMVKNRGFLRFDEFNSFLVDLYQARAPEQTIADLYPQVIEWFDTQQALVGG